MRRLFFFSGKNVRVNLNVSLKAVEQTENKTVQRTVDEHRKWLIQAVIVSIMKTRQALKPAVLMPEVIQQLSSRFKSEIAQIKVRRNRMCCFVEIYWYFDRKGIFRTTDKWNRYSSIFCVKSSPGFDWDSLVSFFSLCARINLKDSVLACHYSCFSLTHIQKNTM